MTSTNFKNEKFLEYDCPFMTTMRFVGKRWKPAVLWKINQGKIRFKTLKKELPLISDKMLSSTINEMEADGIIEKKVYQEVPLKIEYKLTDFGKSILPVLIKMNEWGNKMLDNLN